MTLDAPALEHVCDLQIFVTAPIEAGQVTGLDSRGRRRIIPIAGGTLTGIGTGARGTGSVHPSLYRLV